MTGLFHIGERTKHYLPGVIYISVVTLLTIVSIGLLSDLRERYGTLEAARETLARLESRVRARPSEPVWSTNEDHPGSPLLDGQTVTQASAVLLQRVTGAITAMGGSVTASEVERINTSAKDGLVRVSATAELAQGDLQRLLYDLETGMPFLFVDQLTIQTSSSAGERVRVRLGVSGIWPGAQ